MGFSLIITLQLLGVPPWLEPPWLEPPNGHGFSGGRIGGSYLGVEFVYEALKTDPEVPGGMTDAVAALKDDICVDECIMYIYI